MMNKLNLENVTVNTQSSVRIAGAKIIYFDPLELAEAPHDADIIFISHEHYDHFSPKDIEKAANKDAKEAAKLANEIRPAAVVPMHYGSIVGKPQDAEIFKTRVDKDICVVEKLKF